MLEHHLLAIREIENRPGNANKHGNSGQDERQHALAKDAKQQAGQTGKEQQPDFTCVSSVNDVENFTRTRFGMRNKFVIQHPPLV
jgi:hypothetical protein